MPGAACRCSVAPAANGVRRGSTTIDVPTRRCATMNRSSGGMVSSGLPPATSSTSASPSQATGNGSPRSRPNERFCRRGGRRHAEPSVIIEVRRAECEAREFSEGVHFLVRERAAPEARNRIGPPPPRRRGESRRQRRRALRPSSPRRVRRRGARAARAAAADAQAIPLR